MLQQEEEAQRRKEEEERLAAEERTREAKKPRHGELDLETLAGQEEWEPGALSGLSSRLQSLLETRHPRRMADQDAFVSEKDRKEEAEVEALRQRFKDMKVVARAKVTQDRVYCAAYHPDPTMDLIFFGGGRYTQRVFLRLADDGPFVKINVDNLVYGMRVLPLMMWGKKTTMSIRIREKRGSTGVCKCIGLQLPNRPSHASNLTPSTHILWVHKQLTHPSYLLAFLPSPSIEGIYKCVRLYGSDALVHFRDIA